MNMPARWRYDLEAKTLWLLDEEGNGAGFRRRFVEAVTLPVSSFLARAEENFGEQPVTAVDLADRAPAGIVEGVAWHCWHADESVDPDDRPRAIWGRITARPQMARGRWKVHPDE